MLGLEGKFEFQDLRIIEFNHNISFVGDNTLFATFKQSLFFHELEGIKSTCWEIPRQKYSRKPPSSDATNNLKVRESHLVSSGFFPNRLNFEYLALKSFQRPPSLKVIVLERITRMNSFPGLNHTRIEISVFCIE